MKEKKTVSSASVCTRVKRSCAALIGFLFNTPCETLRQNIPLFLKEKGSARGKIYRGRRSAFSREKKLSFPLASHPFTLIELLVVTAQYCRHLISKACTVPSQNTPLFFESERGFGGKRKPSFLVKRKFSLSPKLSPFTLIELLVSATC